MKPKDIGQERRGIMLTRVNPIRRGLHTSQSEVGKTKKGEQRQLKLSKCIPQHKRLHD